MPTNVNPLIFYAMFALVMILDMVAAYLHLLPGDTATTLFITIVSVLVGVHIPSPVGTQGSTQTPSNQPVNPQV